MEAAIAKLEGLNFEGYYALLFHVWVSVVEIVTQAGDGVTDVSFGLTGSLLVSEDGEGKEVGITDVPFMFVSSLHNVSVFDYGEYICIDIPDRP